MLKSRLIKKSLKSRRHFYIYKLPICKLHLKFLAIKIKSVYSEASLINDSISLYTIFRVYLQLIALVRYISNSYKTLNNNSSFLIKCYMSITFYRSMKVTVSVLDEYKTRDKSEGKTRLSGEGKALKTAIHI